ncbi:MAG: hypothetical protein DRO94_00350 [Candidatus Altiarchaeales archaeon]|nr:MAG: hypothetical protein DRO95_02975 [Candidatus Altiarchaeales archaeon]RLI95473.1 MAG: hypothetical protein DRO94_00350 [Candidatus Altiarchaeales archaeon]HDO82590.1 DUF63 family protein [Candidatus Altiarchaeales archaeon]HEX55239.1 DUF63 family protein [Candidatus Altiarchaeales archaeon]
MGTYRFEDYIIYIAILYVVLYLFIKYFFTRIRIDRDFIVSILPFILLGVFIRILADIDVIERNKLWSITPGVYIISIMAFLISFSISILVSKFIRINAFYFTFVLGTIESLYVLNFIVMRVLYPERILFPILLTSVLIFFLYILFRIPEFEMFRKFENISIISAHLLDASSTFIAYNFFNFSEEHILPNILISLAGGNAIIMIPVKLIVVLCIIYLIEKYESEEGDELELNVYKILRITIFILGIGPGIRNTILPSLFMSF